MEDIKFSGNLLELSSDEFLKRKIEFLRNKLKEIRNEIKRTEDLLQAYESNTIESIEMPKNQLSLVIPSHSTELDFSVRYWKPRVFDFLFDTPSQYTTEQILIGIDLDKKYQSDKANRNKAIKSISSCLFQLGNESKVMKHPNPQRRGFKWSIKEPTLQDSKAG